MKSNLLPSGQKTSVVAAALSWLPCRRMSCYVVKIKCVREYTNPLVLLCRSRFADDRLSFLVHIVNRLSILIYVTDCKSWHVWLTAGGEFASINCYLMRYHSNWCLLKTCWNSLSTVVCVWRTNWWFSPFTPLKEHLREQEFHMDDDVIQEDLQRFMDQPKEFYAAGIQKFTASVAMAGELHWRIGQVVSIHLS